MSEARRKALAAITAGCDQSDAQYRDWLQSQTLAALDGMRGATAHLLAACEESPKSSASYGVLGVVVIARHAILCEMMRRAQAEVERGVK